MDYLLILLIAILVLSVELNFMGISFTHFFIGVIVFYLIIKIVEKVKIWIVYDRKNKENNTFSFTFNADENNDKGGTKNDEDVWKRNRFFWFGNN